MSDDDDISTDTLDDDSTAALPSGGSDSGSTSESTAALPPLISLEEDLQRVTIPEPDIFIALLQRQWASLVFTKVAGVTAGSSPTYGYCMSTVIRKGDKRPRVMESPYTTEGPEAVYFHQSRYHSLDFEVFRTGWFSRHHSTPVTPTVGDIIGGIVIRAHTGHLFYERWFMCSESLYRLWRAVMWGIKPGDVFDLEWTPIVAVLKAAHKYRPYSPRRPRPKRIAPVPGGPRNLVECMLLFLSN